MAKKLDQIIVVDVECTCWQDAPPIGQESDIIEIGICTVDVTSGQRLEKESILVKPERSRVSDFCTQLTTLTQLQDDAWNIAGILSELILRTRQGLQIRASELGTNGLPT